MSFLDRLGEVFAVKHASINKLINPIEMNNAKERIRGAVTLAIQGKNVFTKISDSGNKYSINFYTKGSEQQLGVIEINMENIGSELLLEIGSSNANVPIAEVKDFIDAIKGAIRSLK